MKTKRILAAIAAMTIVFGSTPIQPVAGVVGNLSIMTSAADDVTTEKCGDNASYSLDEFYGELTISGEGAMDDYSSDPSPFSGNTEIKKVMIENGVTSIGGSAFVGCTNITSIEIPDSVTSIGGFVFNSTPWLESRRNETSFVIINGILIDGVTCSGDVILPDSVTSISLGAFYECANITSVTIPDSVTNIGFVAFYGCKNLTDITIENPNCEIPDAEDVIYQSATIYGYTGSTAEKYATKYARTFVS